MENKIIDNKEELILYSLVHNEKYSDSVHPYLKEEYFSKNSQKTLFRIIKDYKEEYKILPDCNHLSIQLEKKEYRVNNEDEYNEIKDLIQYIQSKPEIKESDQWLLDTTEEWVKNRALYNSILESVNIIDGPSGDYGRIAELVEDALSTSFNKNIGLSYFDSAEERWERYSNKARKYKFDLEKLNRITNGGVEDKTLNLIMAPTGVGKSIFLCHLASAYISDGLDVLYITLEMSEEKIQQRIDSNLMNIPINDVVDLPKDAFLEKIRFLKKPSMGELVTVEYPAASSNIYHYKTLLKELKYKKKFIPRILIIDYLNLMNSSRVKFSGDTYNFVKSIAEEVRGFAVEHNLVVWSATQTRRTSGDIEITDTSESWGVPNTSDFFGALCTTDELTIAGQIIFKTLKSRYGGLSKVVLGLDKNHMRFYDVEKSEIGSGMSEDEQINGMNAEAVKDFFGVTDDEDGNTGLSGKFDFNF